MLFSAHMGSMVASFFSTAVQVRFMEPSELGRFVFCLNLMVIAGLVFEFGISSAGARVLALARDRHQERRALGALVVLSAGTGLFLSLFIVATAVPVEMIFKQDVRWLLYGTAAIAFFQPLQWLIEQTCQGLNRIRMLSQFQISWSIGQLLILAGLAAYHSLTAGSALAAYFGAIGIAVIWSLARLRPSFTDTPAHVRLAVAEVRKYGFNVYLARLATTAYSRVDGIVIAYFLGTAPLGLYSAAQKFANPILTMARVLAITRFRAFTRLKEIPGRLIGWNVALLSICSIGLAAAGPVVISLVFPRYAASAPLLVPFAAAALFGGLVQPYNMFLSSHGRGGDLRNIALAVTGTGLIALIGFVQAFQVIGAAWAVAAAMALNFVLHVSCYRRRKTEVALPLAAESVTPTEALSTDGG
jgi:O-antigen/teichoic acid export membrane protein